MSALRIARKKGTSFIKAFRELLTWQFVSTPGKKCYFEHKRISMTDRPILRLLDELEANRKSRRTAWATLQRLRKFLEAHGARISIPEDRNFETEGEAIESGLRRTVEG